MQALENRPWFVLATLVLAATCMGFVWTHTDLSTSWHSMSCFLFATFGLWPLVRVLVALALIRMIPTLGSV